MKNNKATTSRPVSESGTPMQIRLRPAFTLTELIVAIGVTVVLVLGIGRIFSMSKQTISIGQATAELNQYARTFERLMRTDLNHISTDGFLVIRNEQLGRGANSKLNNRPIYFSDEEQLHEIETNKISDMGVRRLDQLVFFATGDFSSYQFQDAYGDGFAPSGIIARNNVSSTARISYGHALRALKLYNPTDTPTPFDAEIKSGPGPNGYRAFFADPRFRPDRPLKNGVDSSNKYAKDWLISRQAALLLPREVAGADDPRNPTYNNLSFAPSFIEYYNESNNYFVPPYYLPQYSTGDRKDYRSLRRRLSPGLVDIIDMDPAEVEKAVTDYGTVYLTQDDQNTGLKEGETALWEDPIGKTIGSLENWSFDAQQSGDVQLFNYVTEQEDRAVLDGDISERWLQGQWTRMAMATGRIRAETTPPSLSRYDQMLSHATLTPGCSNFEVAWSTGEVDFPSGDIVWYDINQPANPYVGVNGQSNRERRERAPADPRIWYLSELPRQALTGGSPFGGPLWPGRGNLKETQDDDLYYALFGYFVPKVRDGGVKQRQGNDTQLNEREDRSEAWPWPKMIRVRVTLHDPSGEIPGGRTFEYVFDIPQPTRG
jgi:type II secretory pathway pseudopilin PulG